DGKWSTWSAWSACDVTCESGSQLRIRSCNNPAPKNGGHYCFGNNTESKVCQKDLCPGLKTVQEIAAQGRTELRLDLTASGGKQVYEVFDHFRLGNAPDYTLHIDHGVGTAGDHYGLSFQNSMKFYTYDHDNTYSCAQNHGGGFWFSNCAYVNLNGQFAHGGDKGVTYNDFNGALATTKMMMRRF
ncbi:ficolin-1-A-like, partial [Mercenaria mercenaria]|uniref:ficolin-1-A-like n=1 Tax=Mercenaria mercenaria TaxID=6596 RepID=UPI00234F48B9